MSQPASLPRPDRLGSLLVLPGLLALPLAAAGADAKDPEPLWELGFGAGALHAPDYPGSSEKHLRALALPYVVYRGEIFRLGDGQTARAVAFENDRLQIDLSFNAAFDAESEKNELRTGMPDLDFMFQLGPQLTIALQDYAFDKGGRGELTLALQARSVFSSDLKRIDQRGYVFEPMLRYRHYGFIRPQLELTLSVRPLWGSERLHAYFYDVDPLYATPARPDYEAEGGYFGTGVNLYANYELTDRASVFFGIQTYSHHGAANVDSPLHEKEFTVGFGAGFVWSPFASKRMVTTP